MSYEVAAKCFVENKAFVNPAGSDPTRIHQWNLNNGLVNLANALASAISAIEQRATYDKINGGTVGIAFRWQNVRC